MEYSRFQLAIFDAIATTNSNLMVEAVAGSGKSTTIEHAIKRLSDDVTILVVAFNKGIVTDLQPRITHPLAQVCTLNSFGNRICRSQMKSIRDLQKDKSAFAFESLLRMDDERERKKFFRYRGTICRLIELFRANLIFNPSTSDIDNLAEEQGIDLPNKADDLQELYGFCLSTFMRHMSNKNVIDFRDQVYFPIHYELHIPRFDVVLIDEVQDLDRNQAELVIRAANRLIMVGDSRQAIYGFRGAMVTAMQELGSRTQAVQLPLSVSYRCPKKAIEMAKQIVPQIEPCDWAPDGQVQDLKIEEFRSQVREGDYILCRCVAPLVTECFALIREGKKAMVKGRDIGEQLLSLVKRIEATEIGAFLEKLETYYAEKYAGFLRVGKEDAAINLKDRVDTVKVLAEDAKTVYDIENRIRDIFKDDVSGIIFMTVHKAKGLENLRIFILSPELMPHPNAKKDWQIQQEMNLKYVALTRVKFDMQSSGELFFVKGLKR